MAPVPPIPSPRESRDFWTRRDAISWSERARAAVRWHITVEEDVNVGGGVDNYWVGEWSPTVVISGQFTPQDFSEEYGANVPDTSGFSREDPLVQWVGGRVKTLTFQARLFSEHRDDQTASEKLAFLKALMERDPNLGRPPIIRFFWGDAIPGGMLGFIESLGGIRYDEIRPDGSIRGVTLNITIKKFVRFQFQQVTTAQEEQTPFHYVKHGETYEMIAYRKWGDPMLGVPLRRLNPRFPMERQAPKLIADLQVNEAVKLIPKSELGPFPIKPESHIFDEDNRIAADNRRYWFETRGTKTAILPRR